MATAKNSTSSYKYHYIYKITNLFPESDECFYIGVHSCNQKPEEDGDYWGSSKYLNEAIKKQGALDFSKEILSVWKTREEANAEEERIHKELNVQDNPKYYNRSNGAKGFFNANRTDEVRQRISAREKLRCSLPEVQQQKSETTKKLWSDPNYRAKVTTKLAERYEDPEYKKMVSEATIIRNKDPEQRKKVSVGVAAKWQDSEFRTRMSEINKTVWNTPEAKAQRSAQTKKQWENPEFRNRMTKGSKEQWNDPEFRNRISTKSLEYWESPEHKKRASLQSKQRWADPEYKEKHTVLLKELAAKKIKTFKLVDPDGVEYLLTGITAKGGLKDFAKEKGMCAVTLQCLCGGTYAAPVNSKYAGWSGSILPTNNQ